MTEVLVWCLAMCVCLILSLGLCSYTPVVLIDYHYSLFTCGSRYWQGIKDYLDCSEVLMSANLILDGWLYFANNLTFTAQHVRYTIFFQVLDSKGNAFLCEKDIFRIINSLFIDQSLQKLHISNKFVPGTKVIWITVFTFTYINLKLPNSEYIQKKCY